MKTFADLPDHIQLELLNECMKIKHNFFDIKIGGWFQQMNDVTNHVKEYLPDITDDQMEEMLFNSDTIYCRITHIPKPLFDIIQFKQY